ncbi:MAG: flagellar hook-basal body complex protein [candidate division Zixibacteria bacterium]|nr:flagellar hook-basal body complex protein [candidate division Zixibacteria bacterium]
MMPSLFAGVSGLRNHQVKMNVVGDNIANVNTVGFKLGRVTFQEALVQTMKGAGRPTSSSGGSNPQQLGLGMSVSTIDNIFLQGGLETTGQITDLALQGSGFFVLSNGQQEFYTRAGSFSFDGDSNMVNPSNGFILQGKMAAVDGTIPASAPIGNITMPFGQQDPARATTEIEFGMNLDSSATESAASLESAGTSNVTSVSGDALNGSGGTHSITITGENATNSEMLGTHANELDNVAAGEVVTNNFNDGAGLLISGTDYFYTVVAVNALGQSTGFEMTHTLAAGNDSIILDWSAYPDIADATSVSIYRSTISGDYSSGNNGLVASVAVGVPNTYTDTGAVAPTNANPPSVNTTVNLTGENILGTQLGVTDATGLQVRVDGGDWINLTQLTTDSTINDLLSAINTNTQGVTAEIVNGQIQITRDFAGSPSTYNVELRDTGTCDISLQVFGAASFVVNNGSASTLQAIDEFTPNVTGIPLAPINLTLVTNPSSGIITGISDIGGGDVSLNTGTGGLVGDPDGAGPLGSSILIVETEDTQHATSISTYDSQGGKHTVTITFTKSWEQNRWYWSADASSNEIIRSGGSGTVDFNPDGSLASFNIDGGTSGLTIDPNNGAELMVIDLLSGTSGAFDGLTGFSSPNTASARSQDGYGLGVLSNISIDASGTITGIFTNGVSRILAQVYIADFNNPAGLLKSGRNLYQTSANSGDAILGIAGSGSSSSITSGALEISNVDLAQEFTNMIVSQRGFQANARVITTSDDMLNELVNLKG